MLQLEEVRYFVVTLNIIKVSLGAQSSNNIFSFVLLIDPPALPFDGEMTILWIFYNLGAAVVLRDSSCDHEAVT